MRIEDCKTVATLKVTNVKKAWFNCVYVSLEKEYITVVNRRNFKRYHYYCDTYEIFEKVASIKEDAEMIKLVNYLKGLQ